jgi:muramoyltetrapeptide carboxypeptidase
VNKPAPLRPGGKIGVVAPAGCIDDESLAAGVEAIRGEGFEVELARGIHDRKGYLAGAAESRVRDLLDFFQRTDIDAIFCARGGFGSIQLLPHLANSEIRPPGKIFVGFSDITVLLNWLLQAGMVTFHAPMVAMEMARGLEARSKKHFWATLTGEVRTWQVNLGQVIRPGKAEAAMMGGCLSLVVTTLGTPYEINTAGKLLFLEDVGEKPYRIERMLTHLKMAAKLDHIAGLVFGDFTQCEGEDSRDVRQIIAELFHDAPYPVVMGMAAGHGKENLTLPFGVKMLLDGDAATLTLTESPVA